MKGARKIDLDQFPQNPDVVNYLDSIKPLLTLNAKVTEEFKKGSNFNHELLTNLQVKQHQLEQMTIPPSEQWKLLEKVIQ